MAKVKIKELIAEIHERKGNISVVAHNLGISRVTVYRKIERYKSVAEAIFEARESTKDNIEAKLIEEALSGNMTGIIFYLKTQAKDRGYTDRLELTGPDGNPLEVKGYVNVSPDDWDEDKEPEG